MTLVLCKMDDSGFSLLLDPLTERELDVLRLMADGFSNPEIADRLIIGLETVRWHTKQIYSKLGVHSRTQASMRARDLGLLAADYVSPAAPVGEQPHDNLPTYTTPFIGREAELNEICALLGGPQARLVTIAGPGGMGKTRLGVEVARTLLPDFADGVCFVPLLPVTSQDEIEPAIAARLNLRLREDGTAREQLLRYLRPKRLLLILDNFEHLINGAEVIAAILEDAPQVKILVTSQASVNLREEWVRFLDALNTTDSAIQLFYDRVQRVRGDFAADDHLKCVAHICALVQGVPLAIELAATWLKTLTCEDVAREIRQNIDFLATTQRDIEARHRSIQAVFEYAWNLLTPEEQGVFRRLSVFRGGFGLAAAQQVAGASALTLSELVGKSLLQYNAAGLYEIHNLLRQYAERKLETLDDTQRTMRSSKLLAWSSLINGRLDRLKTVADGILESASNHSHDTEKGFALVTLGVLAGIEGDVDRAKQLCEAGQPMIGSDPIAHLLAQFGLAVAGLGVEDYAAARRHARAALHQADSLGSPGFTLLCLPLVAVVLAHAAEPENAVELMGLAFTHPASTPGWVEIWPLITELRVELETELGTADYTTAWERGTSQDLGHVISHLLTVL